MDLITEAIRQGVTCKFVVLTSSTKRMTLSGRKKLGVAGYILKEAFPEELLHALRIISKGRKYYDQGVLDLIMKSREPLEEDGHVEQINPKGKGSLN